jgi:enoyl-CoA hydratase
MPRFRLERDGALLRIAFDDGGMNLLSSDALRELRGAIAAITADVSLLVFTSARERLFAAGADMAEMQGFTGLEAERFARLGQELFDEIDRLPCITVAMIDGDCFGGALDLALAFDLRFATPRSRFAHPGAKIGIVTGFGGTSRWRRVLTRAAANQLFLANRVLPADEALRLSLVDRVADSHQDELARLATLDRATSRFVKELSAHAERLSASETLLLARRLGSVYGIE